MSNFLQSQMDYIFFFYGLAFIGLAVVCYILSKESVRLSWIWLGLFGLTHGVNEWLDLLAISWGDGVAFAACRLVIMAVSFVFLVEFGRLSLISLRGWGPRRWLLWVLALAAASGGVEGWVGVNVTTRYFLGLVGGLCAGLVLLWESREAKPQPRPWLSGAGIGLILYALATGVVVPQASFFPASVVNYKAFIQLTGLPVQLIRGLLAVWIATMVVGYFRVSYPAEYERCHIYRARYMYGTGIVLAVILVSGWVLTQFLGNSARERVHDDQLDHSNLVIQHLLSELKTAESAVKAMSDSPWIGPALWSKNPVTIQQANSVLDRYKGDFGVSVAYLLDHTGKIIASSNRDDPDSFVGQSYTFRPPFQQAIAGNLGHHFALGVTSKKRGFYASYPVRDQAGKIVGVAVLKMDMEKFEQELRPIDPTFLIDVNGIVFLASRPDVVFKSLRPVPLEKLAALGQQYGTDQFQAIFSKQPEGRSEVKFAGRDFLVCRLGIDSAMMQGWALVSLVSNRPVLMNRLLGIAVALVMVVLSLVFAGGNLAVREGANKTLAQEARFRIMFSAAPEAVFVFDPETRKILEINPFMAKWLGYAPEELINKEIDEVLDLEAQGIKEKTAPGVQNGRVITPGRRFRRKDGVLVDIEVSEATIPYRGKVRELVFVRDITEQKRAEDALSEAHDKLKKLLSEVGEHNRIMTLSNEMGNLLQSCQVSEEALEVIAQFLPKFFADDAGALYMFDISRSLLEAGATWGNLLQVPTFTPDGCWALRRGRVHLVEDSRSGLLCRHLPESLPAGYLCAPLIAQGEALGILHLQISRLPEGTKGEVLAAMWQSKERLALAVAEDVALALANLNLRETLRSQSIRDPLTGLFNRRYMEETLERELLRGKRQQNYMGVIMMDLDHFKEYNDTFGHGAGDELLKTLGNLVKSKVRGEDVATRYGGEEFLLVMPGASLEISRNRAEALRQEVGKLHMDNIALKPITISLGVAVFPDHGDSSEAILQAADAALYRAKAEGRNRVVTYENRDLG